MSMTRVNVDTACEAYPLLVISENTGREYTFRRELEVPTELYTKLVEAESAVEKAQKELMQYLATHYKYGDIKAWLDDCV